MTPERLDRIRELAAEHGVPVWRYLDGIMSAIRSETAIIEYRSTFNMAKPEDHDRLTELHELRAITLRLLPLVNDLPTGQPSPVRAVGEAGCCAAMPAAQHPADHL